MRRPRTASGQLQGIAGADERKSRPYRMCNAIPLGHKTESVPPPNVYSPRGCCTPATVNVLTVTVTPDSISSDEFALPSASSVPPRNVRL